MKALLKILLGGFVAFMTLAIAQEWDFFSSAWFGDAATAPQAVDPADRRDSEEALREAFALMRHYYASGGDPRFVERAPLSPALAEQLRADTEYLRRNGRRQDPTLQRLEVLEAQALASDRIRLRTRELWIHRFYALEDGRESDPPRSHLLFGEYLVARKGERWILEDWEIADGATAAAAGEEEAVSTEAAE